MTTIKTGDFVSLDYTGMTHEGAVFDTTVESIAKAARLHRQNAKYAPVTICVGEGHLVPGLDHNLVGKEVGKEFQVVLQPEEAFGKKNAAMIQLVAASKFKKANMNPQVGMQVMLDDHLGVVRRAGGGRVLVDFNHPLAGIPVIYKVAVKAQVTDVTEQIKTVIRLPGLDAKVEGDTATLTLPVDLNNEFKDALTKHLLSRVHSVKNVTYAVKAVPVSQATSHDHAHDHKHDHNHDHGHDGHHH